LAAIPEYIALGGNKDVIIGGTSRTAGWSWADGSSTAWSTAADVNSTRLGVCRDYTHLAISFCRALNIPARYVFGYLPDVDVPAEPVEMDFAAWMQVWLGDRWWTFDPRNNVRRKGRVLIGVGRDGPKQIEGVIVRLWIGHEIRILGNECYPVVRHGD
jgi:hypothetical protein